MMAKHEESFDPFYGWVGGEVGVSLNNERTINEKRKITKSSLVQILKETRKEFLMNLECFDG